MKEKPRFKCPVCGEITIGRRKDLSSDIECTCGVVFNARKNLQSSQQNTKQPSSRRTTGKRNHHRKVKSEPVEQKERHPISLGLYVTCGLLLLLLLGNLFIFKSLTSWEKRNADKIIERAQKVCALHKNDSHKMVVEQYDKLLAFIDNRTINQRDIRIWLKRARASATTSWETINKKTLVEMSQDIRILCKHKQYHKALEIYNTMQAFAAGYNITEASMKEALEAANKYKNIAQQHKQQKESFVRVVSTDEPSQDAPITGGLWLQEQDGDSTVVRGQTIYMFPPSYPLKKNNIFFEETLKELQFDLKRSSASRLNKALTRYYLTQMQQMKAKKRIQTQMLHEAAMHAQSRFARALATIRKKQPKSKRMYAWFKRYIKKMANHTLETTQTNIEGKYTFLDIKPGTYVIATAAANDQLYCEWFNQITLDGGNAYEYDLYNKTALHAVRP